MTRRVASFAASFGFCLCVAQAQPGRAAERDGFLYAAGIYDQRYSDTIFTMDAHEPFGFSASSVRPYADVQLNLDSQTLNEAIPSILTDNYALGALGVEYANGKGFRTFAQAGITARLGALAAREPGGDIRAGAELYRGWGGLLTQHPLYGNYYGSAGYISRDRDAVLFNQGEGGRSFRAGRAAVDLYLKAILTLDSAHFYYSNTAEGAIGLRLRSINSSGMTLTLEKSFGAYLRHVTRPEGVASSYRNFRANISYGVPF